MPPFVRERIRTDDQDFLDLDWIINDSNSLVILSHGLEGNSTRAYIKGMARAFSAKGFDILAWNYRGCSGEMNQSLRFYHSGATDDLHRIIMHSLKKGYQKIYLIGFSLGGNLTLKYLGDMGKQVNHEIKKAVAFSVPMDLYSSCTQLSKKENWLYAFRFLKNLKRKVIDKSKIRNDLSIGKIDEIKTLIEFDDTYTAPIHGFKNAIDYYTQCSSIYVLENIQVPTLIVNAQNDPFLSLSCFPDKQYKQVRLEYPKHGGHVGFSLFNQNGLYWSELRALHFIHND